MNGTEIIEQMGIPPGPMVASLKNLVKEAIIEGIIPYDHDKAWEYLKERLPEILKK